ncbi:MAG: diguanylate cyclase [Planctomycetes bacterium]|nr:diguanylate cyclase [Planctomycetota bacterium]
MTTDTHTASFAASDDRILRGRLVSSLEALEELEATGELDAGGRATARRLADHLADIGGLTSTAAVVEAAQRLRSVLRLDAVAVPRLRELCHAVRAAVGGATLQKDEVVLVVEDDPGMQEVLLESLTSPRWELLTAASVAEAQRVLSDREVSLVILDLRLPDGDGRDVLSFMRHDPTLHTVPVVVTSGSGGLPVTEALALGADGYVPKPFDPHLLKATAAGLLARHAERSRESRVDALTGLPNRLALEETFQRVQAHAQRAKERFSVAILDLNSFKSINDTHGHLTGDQLLRWFARVMRQSLRAADYFARWGGDEFVAVLPGTPVTGGVTVLEHCLLSIESAPFMTPLGVPLRACFSAGVVEVGPRDTLQQVLSEADRRLYRMKSTGRLELPDL